MKKIKMFKTSSVAIIFLLLVLYSASLCEVNEPNVPVEIKKTEVIIVGTIHGRHYQNPNYSPKVLRDIILSLKPEIILNELPLSQVDPNGRPIHRDYESHAEGWASDYVAVKLGIKQIPFDRPDREKNYRVTDYFKRQNKYMELVQKWANEREQKEPNCVDLKLVRSWSDASHTQWYLDVHGSPENINSEGYDRLIRLKQTLYKEVIPGLFRKYSGYEILADEGEFFREQWQSRNKIMAENILKAAMEYKGKRIVVLTGSEHRYILRDLLKDENTIELKEYWQAIKK
jgi:hypothetical protein